MTIVTKGATVVIPVVTNASAKVEGTAVNTAYVTVIPSVSGLPV